VPQNSPSGWTEKPGAPQHYFNDLSAWCRSAGLTQEGETVEAAVRASG